MSSAYSRRDFLKVSGLALGALALNPWPPDDRTPVFRGRGRVTVHFIYIYREPDFKSERVGTAGRDTILRLLEEVDSPAGPVHNPRWYRIEAGYVHSAYLQRVEKAHASIPLDSLPAAGQLGEMSLPITQALVLKPQGDWQPLYRLYYQSVHWITGLRSGPDGAPWYELTDDWLHVRYFVPAAAVRPVQPEELTPLSPDVPAGHKRIEVSIASQTLTAFEGKEEVLHTTVSTGIPGMEPTPQDIPTATPQGSFHVEVKVPSRHMGDGHLTSDYEAYELPGVPWVSFFHPLGIGLHGTYWHDNFGRMMSHGCVNMRMAEAKWIYRWSSPVAVAGERHTIGLGTVIKIV